MAKDTLRWKNVYEQKSCESNANIFQPHLENYVQRCLKCR